MSDKNNKIIGFSAEKFGIEFTRGAKPREFWCDELTFRQIGEVNRVQASQEADEFSSFMRELLTARAVDKKPVTVEEVEAIGVKKLLQIIKALNGSESENPK